jgi:hypothetical protein
MDMLIYILQGLKELRSLQGKIEKAANGERGYFKNLPL